MFSRVATILSIVMAVATLGLIGVHGASGAEDGGNSPVVVELFTSQGCSSCPPADALVEKLAKRPGIIVISWPVHYWNYLGWRDTLSRKLFTKRQKAYMHSFEERFVYTPQIVVNGRREMVGSKTEKVLAAIEEAAGDKDFVPMTAEHAGEHIMLKIDSGNADGPATVWVVDILSKKDVAIDAGENAGRLITYTNVARDVRRIGTWEGARQTLMLEKSELTAGDGDGCTILLQEGETGPIRGALEIPEAVLAAGR